jgi:hypothetical protein
VVKAPVPGQQPVGLQARVSTDEEIRDYALPGAAARAIAAPRLTGAVSTSPLQRAERRANCKVLTETPGRRWGLR